MLPLPLQLLLQLLTPPSAFRALAKPGQPRNMNFKAATADELAAKWAAVHLSFDVVTDVVEGKGRGEERSKGGRRGEKKRRGKRRKGGRKEGKRLAP